MNIYETASSPKSDLGSARVTAPVFFRGKSGIARLQSMANAGILVSARDESAAHGVTLLNRLEQLKLQKKELEGKQGIIFRDSNVENAIEIVDAEIESVQGELAVVHPSKTRQAV